MNANFEQHCTEKSLESYAMGTLDDPNTEILEEHILVCENCRNRLDEADRYVLAMRGAAARLRRKPEEASFLERIRSWFTLPAPAWVAAAAACVFGIAALTQMRHIQRPPVADERPLVVNLPAERGGTVSVPAHHVLDLKLDTRGLTLGSQTRVTLVAENKEKLEDLLVAPKAGALELITRAKMEAGSYVVDTYDPVTQNLLREFSLTVN